MEFKSYLSFGTNAEKIVEELTSATSGSYDLAFVFVTSFNKNTTEKILEELKKKLSVKNLLGCTCAGIIGSQNEVERQPATCLILAKFSEVKILPFYLNQAQLEKFELPEDLYRFFEIYPNERPYFLVLPDPFMLDIDQFLKKINQAYPGNPVIGGLASGANRPGENTLFINNERYKEGMIGVALTGNICIETIVSQGCRPIGETFIVTKAEGNVIYELAGKPLYEVLKSVLGKASQRDQELATEAILLGIAMNEYQHSFKRGDFLIRGLIGLDYSSGAGAVADVVRTGQTVQFHLRDAATASEDLNELLGSFQSQKNNQKPKGALVFSCNGRGEGLFRQQNHDIKVIQQYVGPVPAAGFFCAGEIGPVCQHNFLHGFTSSVALFYPQN